MPFPNMDGRPTKYKPEYRELLIEHLSQGKSFESLGALIYQRDNEVMVGKRTLYDWVKAHPDFAEAKEFATGMALEFWEEMGITAVNSPPSQFNSTLWIFSMKNKFGWTDKVEHSGNSEKPIEVKGATISGLNESDI